MTIKQIHRPGAMPRWQRWSFWIGMGLCCFSGLSYLLGHEFFMAPEILSHRRMLTLHGIAAGVAVFLLGTIAVGHVRVGWILRKNKLTGMSNIIVLGLLVLTGWGLYYGSEEMRDLTVSGHWISGLMFIIALSLHLAPSPIRQVK